MSWIWLILIEFERKLKNFQVFLSFWRFFWFWDKMVISRLFLIRFEIGLRHLKGLAKRGQGYQKGGKASRNRSKIDNKRDIAIWKKFLSFCENCSKIDQISLKFVNFCWFCCFFLFPVDFCCFCCFLVRKVFICAT